MGLSSSIRISAEVSFILSQFTRLTDRQTDIEVMANTALHSCSAAVKKPSASSAAEVLPNAI